MAGTSDGTSGAGPDSPRRRPQPPVLDLKATEVTAESAPAAPDSPPETKPEVAEPATRNEFETPEVTAETAPSAVDPPSAASEPPPPEETPPTPRQPPPVDREAHRERRERPVAWHPVALVVGAGAGAAAGALALLVVAGLTGLPLGRDDEAAGVAARLQEVETRVGELAARPAAPADRRIDELLGRIAALEKAPRGAQNADPELAKRIAALEQTGKSLTETVAELRTRVDEAVTVARAAREAAVGAAGPSGAANADIEALSQRIAALEAASKALQGALAQPRAAEPDRAARLAAAAFALRAAVESGAPFAPELAAAKSLADPAKLAPLEPFAAGGVPSAAALARELTALIAAARQPPPGSNENVGWFERLHAGAARLVRIRPADAPATLDPADVLARIQAAATRGDLAAALTEAGALPEAARTPLEPWIKKAQARALALAAAQDLFRDSLTQLPVRSAEPGTR